MAELLTGRRGCSCDHGNRQILTERDVRATLNGTGRFQAFRPNKNVKRESG